MTLTTVAEQSLAQPDGDPPGWATQALTSSLRRSALLAAAVWQVVVIWAVLTTEPRISQTVLVVAHVAVALLALGLLRLGWAPWPAIVLILALMPLNFIVTGSPDDSLVLATCWSGNTAFFISVLVLRGTTVWAVPVVGALVNGVLVLLLRPGWTVAQSVAVVVTATMMALAGRIAVPRLLRLAADADRASALAEQDRKAAVAARRATHEAAEHARVLHDTVVNTLGAIAKGGAAVHDRQAVSDLCARDIRTVTDLLDDVVVEPFSSLVDRTDWYPGVEIRRRGLSDDQLMVLETVMAPEIVRALAGATRELVLNAAKHADVSVVDLHAQRADGDLMITVTDQGAGFDPDRVELRGLDSSVLDPIARVGGTVTFTSRPGSGTQVVIRAPLEAPEAPTESLVGDDPNLWVISVRHRACWLWAAGVIAVGVGIEAANRPGVLSWTYAMLALVAFWSVCCGYVTRSGSRLPDWMALAVILSVAPAFALSMAGTDFGRTAVFNYQAIGLTPLLVILLVTSSRRAMILGLVMLSAGVLAITMLVWQQSYAAASVVVVGAAPAFGMAAAWWGFHNLIGKIALQAHADRTAAFESQLETWGLAAEAETRERWRAAGLRNCLPLLRGLADNTLDPDSPSVQQACAQEEQYLRTLVQLSPGSVHTGVWWARALAEARAKEIDLTIRTGDADVSDTFGAHVIGQLALTAIALTPERGKLHITLFVTLDRSPRLTLVGGLGHLVSVVPSTLTEGWHARYQSLDHQDLIEVMGPSAAVSYEHV